MIRKNDTGEVLPPTGGLLTTRQAAERIGRAPATLNMDRVNGTGPDYVKVGRSVRYRPADLDAFIAARVRRSTSDDGRAA